MTHPITGHSERCLCERCEQIVDVPALLAEVALLRELERRVRSPKMMSISMTLALLDEFRAKQAPPAPVDTVDDSGPTLEERVVSCERAIADLRKLVHELNQRTIGIAK